MKRRLVFILVFALIFFLNFISAENASSASYNVGKYHLGISGNNGSSDSYSMRSTTTYQQGVGNFSNPTYTGRASWFSIITEEAEEEASVEEAPVSGGGGGGGGAALIVTEISGLIIIPQSFNLPATAGINSSAKLALTNTRDAELSIRLSVANINEIIEFEETDISILPGETKIIKFKIIPPNEPGVYTGKISLIAGGGRTEIPFALNVNSGLSLFDVSINLDEKYKTIKEGEKIKGQITLIQAGLQEKIDVAINYIIKDFNGKIYSGVSETTSIFREKTFEYEFDTSSLLAGEYVIGIEVIYSGGVATASHQFKVTETIVKKIGWLTIIEIILILSIILVLVIIAKKYKQNGSI